MNFWAIMLGHIIDGGFALAAAWIALAVRRQIKTPSGDPIGHVAERTHDLAAVSVKQIHKLNGDE